jgi:class 3 adenylate cyclase
MSQSRQLAAIMFADIVGYSAQMGVDEQKAFELLKRNREIQIPIIEKHRGRWLKEMGDGTLVSFQSVSDAVQCAILFTASFQSPAPGPVGENGIAASWKFQASPPPD